MKIKFLLDEEEIPKKWYNVAADLPTPLDPPLNPQTGEVLKPEDAEVIFPKSLIKQEMSTDRWIDIPDEVREIYKLWRPTPTLSSSSAGEGAEDPCQDLLQI